MTYERPKIETYKIGDARKYAQLKRDGIMVTVITDGKGCVECLTRHPDGAHRIYPNLAPIGKLISSPWVGALFCELYAPAEPASQVKSHLAEERWDRLRIEAFAIPSQAGALSLESIRDMCKLIHFPFIEFKTWLDLECDTDGDIFSYCDQNEYEGIVFKDSNLCGWLKWKPVLTTDLVVLGFKEGRGKYLGTLGALVLGLADGTEVCHCSGMDDATRDQISENEDEWLGKIVEVAYQRLDSGGGLRHPRFVGRRDDKEASECTQI